MTLTVPLDHFGPPDGPTIDVMFGLRRAMSRAPTDQVFVTATGGPGTAGLASAAGYTSAFARELRDTNHIVFFDQRGVGHSGPIQCPIASTEFYLTAEDPATSTATTGYPVAATHYVDACIAEAGVDRETLQYYSTRQAIADLEALRIWLEVDRIDLYGESYGTQFAQAYAGAHPGQVDSLLVDGSVDLELQGTDYWAEATRSFDRTLVATLLDCTADETCTADMAGGDALLAYDGLAASLDEADRPYTFVRADGSTEERLLRAVDLENAAAGYAYDEFDRMLFLRALAAASRGDLLPMARAAYLAIGQDPETLEAMPDPTYSDALYYSVECVDYDYPGGTPEERAQGYLDAGRAADIDSSRLSGVFYGDLPCAFWPARPPLAERPEGLTDTPFPVFVLGATLDPVTPWANAERIFERLTGERYLLVKPGGPHIIFGRGEPCPDDPVTAFLVDGKQPRAERTTCPGDEVDDYVAVAPPSADAYADELAALASAEDQILNDADYWGWDEEEPLVVGCREGGTLRYEATDRGYNLGLDGCAFAAGMPLTGQAFSGFGGRFSLDVRVPGGRLRYAHSGGERSVVGRIDGRPVRISEPD
ncbi:MAG: alpha/beta hydrolase [Candidatus Limnocylindrales bacterium]